MIPCIRVSKRFCAGVRTRRVRKFRDLYHQNTTILPRARDGPSWRAASRGLARRAGLLVGCPVIWGFRLCCSRLRLHVERVQQTPFPEAPLPSSSAQHEFQSVHFLHPEVARHIGVHGATCVPQSVGPQAQDSKRAEHLPKR